MNLRDARQEALAHIAAGNSFIVVSEPGRGKSTMARKLFEYLRDRDAPKGIRWGFKAIFAATHIPPDFIGFQFKGSRTVQDITGKERTFTTTDPSMPLWYISDEGLPACCYDKFFLVIEEMGQGEPDVKRACAELMLNGGAGEYYLPVGSVRMACTNEGSRHGVTKDFDFCINRRQQINLTDDIRVWLEDFADKPYEHQGEVWLTSPVIKSWAHDHPEAFYEALPAKQRPWATPRSVCMADRYLQVKTLMNNGVVPTDGSTEAGIAGYIGVPSTSSLMQHIQFMLELPQYDLVAADPMNTPVPSKADMLLLMAYQLAGLTRAGDLANVIKYVQRMPPDMSITYVSSLLRRDWRTFNGDPAMKGWCAKNANILNTITALSN